MLPGKIQAVPGLALDKSRILRLFELAIEGADLGAEIAHLPHQSLFIAMQPPQPPQDPVENETGAEEEHAQQKNLTRAMKEAAEGKTEFLQSHWD